MATVLDKLRNEAQEALEELFALQPGPSELEAVTGIMKCNIEQIQIFRKYVASLDAQDVPESVAEIEEPTAKASPTPAKTPKTKRSEKIEISKMDFSKSSNSEMLSYLKDTHGIDGLELTKKWKGNDTVRRKMLVKLCSNVDSAFERYINLSPREISALAREAGISIAFPPNIKSAADKTTYVAYKLIRAGRFTKPN